MASTNAYRAAVLATSGLVSYWRLADAPGATTAVDENSAANNGTYNGSPALDYGTPLIGDSTGSMLFDGTNDYVEIANETNFDLEHTGTWSLEFWLWVPAGLGNGDYTIFSKRNGASPFVGYDLNLRVAGGKFGFSALIVPTGAGTYLERYMQYTTGVTAGCWHHIVFTWGGSVANAATTAGKAKLYFDGSETAEYFNSIATLTSASASILNDLPPRLGRQAAGAAQYLPANLKLKDFAFYNVELSAATVAAHYTAATTYTLDYAATNAATNMGPCNQALQGRCDVYFLADSINAWNGAGEAIAQHMPDKLLAVGAIPSIRGRYRPEMSRNPTYNGGYIGETTHGTDVTALDGDFVGAEKCAMPTGILTVDGHTTAEPGDGDYLMAGGNAALSAECPAGTTWFRGFIRCISGSTALASEVLTISYRPGLGGTPGADVNVPMTAASLLSGSGDEAAGITGNVRFVIEALTSARPYDGKKIMHHGSMIFDLAGQGPMFLDIIGGGGYQTYDFWSDSAGSHQMATTGAYSLVEFATRAKLSNTMIVFDCTGVNDAAVPQPVADWDDWRAAIRNRWSYVAQQAGYSKYIHVYVQMYRPSTVGRTLWAQYAAADRALANGNDGALCIPAVLGSVCPEGTGATPIVDDNVHPSTQTNAQTLATWLAEMIDAAPISSGTGGKGRAHRYLTLDRTAERRRETRSITNRGKRHG